MAYLLYPEKALSLTISKKQRGSTNMQDDVLPVHDFFIYVPVVRGKNHQADHSKSGNNILRTPEAMDTPALFQSWKKIALADTFDVYVRLEQDAHPALMPG
jgi:hypothetical protein